MDIATVMVEGMPNESWLSSAKVFALSAKLIETFELMESKLRLAETSPSRLLKEREPTDSVPFSQEEVDVL
jgi:hypothetical protein